MVPRSHSPTPRFGVHLSISPEFKAAAERGGEIGCEALQIFCGNPRGWAKKPVDPDKAQRFRDAVKSAGIDPVVVHATYLINPAAPDAMYDKSVAALVEEIARSHALGAGVYVVHPGSHRGAGPGPAESRIAAALDSACRAVPGPIRILLENTAGGKNVMGTSIEELGRILERCKHADRVGICLDTCHALAAGCELRTKSGLDELIDRIDRHVGLSRLGCLHINDSKFDLASGRDRHEHIGRGFIGERGFRNFLRHGAFAGLPAILETPQDRPNDDRDNLNAAKRLAGRRPVRPARNLSPKRKK